MSFFIFFNILLIVSIIGSIEGKPIDEVSSDSNIKGSTLKDFCFYAEKLSDLNLSPTEISMNLSNELEKLIRRENPSLEPKDVSMTGFINMIVSDLLSIVLNSSRRKSLINDQSNKLSNDCPSYCSIIEWPETINLSSGNGFTIHYDASSFVQTLLCHGINFVPSIKSSIVSIPEKNSV